MWGFDFAGEDGILVTLLYTSTANFEQRHFLRGKKRELTPSKAASSVPNGGIHGLLMLRDCFELTLQFLPLDF